MVDSRSILVARAIPFHALTMSQTFDWTQVALASTNVLAISSASVNASLTFITVPRILELPTPLNVRRWQSMFNVTKWWVAGPMVFSGLSYFGLAYRLRYGPLVFRLLVASGALCISIVPFTRVIVLPTIEKLWEKVEVFQGKPDSDNLEEDGETTHSLIQAWGSWNLGRAIPVMTADCIGLYTALLI